MALYTKQIAKIMVIVATLGLGCTYNTYYTQDGQAQPAPSGSASATPSSSASSDDAGTPPTDDAGSDAADQCSRSGECPVPNATACLGTYICCPTSGGLVWAKDDCKNAVAPVADSGAPSTDDAGAAPEDSGATPPPSASIADSGAADPTPPPADIADSGAADTGSAPAPTSVDSGVADSAPADTGPVTPPPPPPVTTADLEIHVRIPQAGTHNVTLYDFGSWPAWSQSNSGNGIIVHRTVTKGSTFVLNGTIDGQWLFVDYLTGKPLVAAWAFVDGLPAGRVTSQKNSKGDAYDLVFTATPAATAANDKDGDGFTTDNPDWTLRDCNDDPSTDGNGIYPGQVETTGDSIDFDCNKFLDPERFIVRLMDVPAGFSPMVYDAAHYPASLPMTWNAAVGAFDSMPYDRASFPSDFMVSWGASLWSTSWNGSVCLQNVPIMVFSDQTGALVPVTAQYSVAGSSCHQFATLPAP